MVSQMRWFPDREIESPNISLSPDNDVQVQIEATLGEMSTQFSLMWVQGHQDNTSTEELSWEAILNIERQINSLPRLGIKQRPRVLHLSNCLHVK